MLVLPAPLGPMTAKNWPRSTARLTPARAATPPKLRYRFSSARSPIRSCTPSSSPLAGSNPERTYVRAGSTYLLGAGRMRLNGWGVKRLSTTPVGSRRDDQQETLSGALELRQDRPGEQLDVSLREVVRHAAELKEAHDHAGADLLHMGLDLAGDRVGSA